MAKKESSASQDGRLGDAPPQVRYPEERFGTEGAEPQTGDRHRIERGAGQGCRCPRRTGRAQPRRTVADVVVPPVIVRSVGVRSVTVAQVGVAQIHVAQIHVAHIGETLAHGLAPLGPW